MYFICLVRNNAWNMNHVDVVTAFFNVVVYDNAISMTMHEGELQRFNITGITVEWIVVLHGLKPAL
jgi:hypothetical protein